MAADTRRSRPSQARRRLADTTTTKAKRAELMQNFHRRAYPTLEANIDLSAPVTCQPMNVTWPHIGTPPYTLMVTIEQWTTDVLSLAESYFDSIPPNGTALFQYMIPSFNGNDGPTNPNIMVSITDSSGHMSNSSSIVQVSNGTLTCPESGSYVDFYIVIPDGATPSQCRPWSLSWQHIDASPQTLVPPLSIFILQSAEPPITIRIPTNVTSVRSNGSEPDGTYSFILPVQGQKRFLTTMSDHGPLGSGGVLGLTTPAADESNPDDCLFQEAMDKYPRVLPTPTRTLEVRPTITPIIDGSAKGIPILVSSGSTVTTGFVAYGNADQGAQTVYDMGPGGGGDSIGGPLGTGGLIGVVLGAGFVAGALLATLAWLFIRSRRRDRQLFRMQQAEMERLAAKHGGGGGHHHNGFAGGGGGGAVNGTGESSSDAGTTLGGRTSSHLKHLPSGTENGSRNTEMRQAFSDPPSPPTEELRSSSPQARRRNNNNGDAAVAGGGVAAAMGGLVTRFRRGGPNGNDETDSFHSLHSLDPVGGGGTTTAGGSSTPSMSTSAATPRTPGARGGPRRGTAAAGDSSPTSPHSGTGSLYLPFADRAGDLGSSAHAGSPTTDPSGSSSWAASSTYNSSRRGGGGAPGQQGGGPNAGSRSALGGAGGSRGTPNVVQHADAGLIMDDNVFDDEDVVGRMVELPPQYDSIEIRGSPALGPSVSTGSGHHHGSQSHIGGTAGGGGGGGGGGGAGSSSGRNSAGPSNGGGGGGIGFSTSSGSGTGPSGWYPTSPTSGSGNGYGSGTGTGESSDLLMANAGRSQSAGLAGPSSAMASDRAAATDGFGGSAPASSGGLGSAAHISPATGGSSSAGAIPPSGSVVTSSTMPSSPTPAPAPAPTRPDPSAPPPGSSSTSPNEKRPKLKLATPATAAASGLLEDLLRGHGAGPQYAFARSGDGESSPLAHNHPIDVGEAEPEEWETIPPEVLRRTGVRRRVAGSGTCGAGTGGSYTVGPAGGSSSTGSNSAGLGAGGGTGGGSATGGVGGAAGGSLPAQPQQQDGGEDEYEDEQVPDESEFWIVPRG
ncbi:hypothetical protein V8E36_003275 [Tilletia maclaganii]